MDDRSTKRIDLQNKGFTIHITTPIPTPSGHKLANDIRLGDTVLLANGEKTHVTEKHICVSKEYYRVKISDNEEFMCHDLDKWVITFTNMADTTVIDTKSLYSYFEKYKSKQYIALPKIPLIAKPIEFESMYIDLPMDPYEYGLMIGGRISTYDVEDYLEKAGYHLQKFNGYKPPKARFNLWMDKEMTRLPGASRADMGLYLYLPLKERLAVFQGCVDSDAKIDKDFRVVFQVKNDPAKVEFYRCLASSFGFHVHDKYYKRRVHTGTDYICSFQAKSTLPVSRLEAKLNKLPKHATAEKYAYKKIISVTKHKTAVDQYSVRLDLLGAMPIKALVIGHLYTVVAA